MKIKSWIIVLLGVAASFGTAQAQLDTLYFEDFLDNRRNWKEYANAGGSAAIRDGHLEVEVIQVKRRVYFTYITVDPAPKDTFVYELRLKLDSVTYGGAIYDVNYTTSKRTERDVLCCYDAMVTHRKGINCYQYNNSDGDSDFSWSKRWPQANQGTVTYRVEYGSNRFHCYLNDQLVGSYRQPKRRGSHDFRKWGWMCRGNAKFKVDYLRLRGK